MRDIYKTLPVILVCGGAVALGAGLGYLIFLRLCAGCMVWTAIIVALGTAIAVTLIAYFKAGILTQETIDIAVRPVHCCVLCVLCVVCVRWSVVLGVCTEPFSSLPLAASLPPSLAALPQVSSFNDHAGTSTSVTVPDKLASGSSKEKRRWEYFAYFMTAFSIILLVVIVFMRRRIRIAVAIVKEASGTPAALTVLFRPCAPLSDIVFSICAFVRLSPPVPCGLMHCVRSPCRALRCMLCIAGCTRI
jgi:hypothetical protein